jgi:hypothetical protein
MAVTKQRRQITIDEIRNDVTMLFQAYENLLGDSSSWDNGVASAIVDATGQDPNAVGYQANDFVGHEGLQKADVNQCLGAGLVALKAFVESANGKKMAELRKS